MIAQSETQFFQQTEALLNMRKPGEAIAYVLNQPARFFIIAKTQNLLALAYQRSGDIPSAQRAIELAKLLGASASSLMRVQCGVYRALKDWNNLEKMLGVIVAEAPDDGPMRYQLALCKIEIGQIAEAKHHAQILLKREQDSMLAHEVLYRIAVAEDEDDAALEALKWMAFKGEKLPDLPKLLSILWFVNKVDRKAISHAIVASSPEYARQLAPFLDEGGIEESVLTTDQRGLSLALAGKKAAALEQLNSLDPVEFPDIADLREIISMLPQPSEYRRPLIKDDGRDVIISAAGSSGITLLVFTGLADRVGLPITVLDAFCAAQGHSAIYLRDAHRLVFLKGILELGDSQDETIDALQVILNDLGTKRLVCWGNSAGGFGAIRYGLKLGATHILCTSAPINMRADFIASIQDLRGKVVVKRLNKLLPSSELDVSRDILEAGGRCAIDLWYGSESREDVLHAESVANYPGVTLFSIAGHDRHNTSVQAITAGGLDALLSMTDEV